MKLSNVGMTQMQAWNAYREYRVAIGKGGDQKDRAVMAGYKALAKGKTVIDLIQVMREAGFHENGMPRVAICRADASRCVCRRSPEGRIDFDPNVGRKGIWMRLEPPLIREYMRAATIVPLIPPKYRPGPTALKNYFILWEADWKMVPKDPALLKHLAGNLYSVVAEWDLTPVEQAVLRQ